MNEKLMIYFLDILGGPNVGKNQVSMMRRSGIKGG